MARMIDADALKTDLTRFYDNEVTAKRLIDEQPTINAIPVEWLEAHKMECIDDWGVVPITIGRALIMWQKEKEAG